MSPLRNTKSIKRYSILQKWIFADTYVFELIRNADIFFLQAILDDNNWHLYSFSVSAIHAIWFDSPVFFEVGWLPKILWIIYTVIKLYTTNLKNLLHFQKVIGHHFQVFLKVWGWRGKIYRICFQNQW